MPERGRSRRRTAATVVAAAALFGMLAFLVYASTPMSAEAHRLSAVYSDTAIRVTESPDAMILTPADAATGQGLVFIAGARVDPAAYAYKLSGIAEAGVTVVIARPVLGFAIMEFRPLSTFTSLAPEVARWAVGGHSLGGVRACQYVADGAAGATGDGESGTGVNDPDALVLFGSYCAVDISTSGVPGLSLAGSADGLSTAEKIADAAALLPAAARFATIPGANHASFGDYGLQPGDGTATAGDAEVRSAITRAVLAALDG